MINVYHFYKYILHAFFISLLLFSGMSESRAQTTLFSDDFEAAGSVNTPTTTTGYNGWRKYSPAAGTSFWRISNSSGRGCVLSGSWSAMMCSGAFSCHYGADDPSGSYFTSSNNILYHAVNTTGYTSIKVNFKWEAGGESGADYGKVCWSTNGTTWTDLSPTYLDYTTTQTVTNLALPAGAENQATLYVGWRWKNDNNYVPEFEQGFSIDDISITGVGSCTGTPSAPVAGAASDIGTTSFTANWTAAANANAYYLDVSTSNTFSSFVSGYNNRSVGNVTSYIVTGLSTGTNYYYRVRAKCTGTSGNSTTISTSTTANYCAAGPTNGSGDGITRVQFNTIDNTSSINQWYADFTDISTTVSRNVSYNLTVRVTTWGGGMGQACQKAWIDWDHNGVFNTTTEEYNLGTATGTDITTSLSPRAITVPASALYGPTRMRVMTQAGSIAPTSCDNFSWGEAEDYTITVGNPPGTAYGIYAPGAITGVSDCEIYAEGGSGTSGCLVCQPTSSGYTNVNISGYPVITATNTACTGTNITLATSATSPNWTGSSSPLTGTGASKTIQYTTTGRKNITLAASTSCPTTNTTVTPNTAIPDNGCSVNTYAYSTITVPDYGSCKVNTANMSIRINITHGNVGDLLIYLKAPNNKLLCVSTGNGGTGNNYTNTVFSDGGATNIASGTAPFTGTYRPEGSTGSAGCATPTSGVVSFATLGSSSYNPTGNWTLYVFDEASGNSGTLVDWRLTLPAATGGGSATYSYTGFTNMMMVPPSAGSVTGTPNGCPGTYAYGSTAAGTPGFTYSWSVSPSAGTTVYSPTSSSTNINFPNSSGTYTVTCNETSECCGALPAITYTTTIAGPPVAPTITTTTTTPCVGSNARITATAPANASFAFYDALTGGNLLATGPSYTTPAATLGATTFYVEAVNASGCSSSPRTPVTVTGVATTPPTVPAVTRCGTGTATMEVTSPGTGYTYKWYSGSCGGVLLQSSTGISYSVTASSTTTYYVSATAPGCAESNCTAVTITVNNLESTLTWVGSQSGANNWFNPINWGGCLPTCASDVTIPAAVTYPPSIGFNAEGGAACKSITIQLGSTLSFSDPKAELSVCGNVTHNGTLTSNSVGTLIFNGTAGGQTYTKGASGSGEFNDIILNNTSGTPTLTLSSDLIVSSGGTFVFQSGKVITGANNLIIKNIESAAVTGHNASRYVEGNLRRYINTGVPTSYDFPVGTSAKGYQLANVSFTTVPSTITYLTAFFSAYSVVPSALNVSECMATYNRAALNNGYWDISANNSQNNVGLYNMTLYNTNYTNAFSGFTVMSQHNGSATWALVNGDGSNGNCVVSPVTAVERRNMKGFSKFGVAQSLSVLPVELLSFDAIYNGQSTDVNWTTASEKNNDYFIVERSTDAKDFDFIEKVHSKAKGGNSTSILNYTLNDPDVKAGIYYYRLKQVDFDGKFTYSSMATVTIEDKEILIVTPNPTDNSADVIYESNSIGVALLKVYDTGGRLVIAKELVCTKGHNSYALDLQKEISGMFYITLSIGDKVHHAKLLKQ